MNAKIKKHQYVIFIKLQKYDTTDAKFFLVVELTGIGMRDIVVKWKGAMVRWLKACDSVLQIRRDNMNNLGIIFIFFHLNIHCDPSLESSH